MADVLVQDVSGRPLSPCTRERAESLVSEGKASWIASTPPAIRLLRSVTRRDPAPPEPHPLVGKRTLLHICCGPCATYTVQAFRAAGGILTGYWYNPNIQPFSEHTARLQALESLAGQIDLPVIWEPGYDVVAFLRAVSGQEALGLRCRICYRQRLDRTARAAAEGGFEAFSTTLLISPYQNLEEIRLLGNEAAERWRVPFYWENLRRGFAEHHRLAKRYGLYRQRYCGCLFSEWEALDRTATTRGSPDAGAESDTAAEAC